jgi:hypothetical protein
MFYVYISFTVSNKVIITMSDTNLMEINNKVDSEMSGNIKIFNSSK